MVCGRITPVASCETWSVPHRREAVTTGPGPACPLRGVGPSSDLTPSQGLGHTVAPAPARQAPHVCGTDIQLPGCLLWCPRGPRGPGLLVWGFPPREQTRHSQALGGEDGATEPFEGSCGAGGSGGSAAGEAGQDLRGSVQSRQSSEEGPERAHTRSMDGVGAGSSEVAGCTVVCSTGGRRRREEQWEFQHCTWWGA